MCLIKVYESEQLQEECYKTAESIRSLKRIPENLLTEEAIIHINYAIAKLEIKLFEQKKEYDNKRNMEQMEFFDSLDARTKGKITFRGWGKYHPSDLPWGWSLDG
jgi:hypothetical protein